MNRKSRPHGGSLKGRALSVLAAISLSLISSNCTKTSHADPLQAVPAGAVAGGPAVVPPTAGSAAETSPAPATPTAAPRQADVPAAVTPVPGVTVAPPAAAIIPIKPTSPAVAPQPVSPTAMVPTDQRAPGHITVRMMRIAVSPIGAADTVTLWVKGDGSGASLRLRLLNVVQGPWATRDVTLQPSWISKTQTINFTGWRQLAFNRASFTLKVPSAAALAINPLLPADAQRPGAASVVDRSWEDANAIVLETTVTALSRTGLDDIAWAQSNGKGGYTTSTIVDDFETGNVAAWKAVGSRDEQAAVSFGVKSQPGQAHGGKIALYYTGFSPASRRATVLMPLAKRIMAVTGQPYIVFTPDALFEPILPFTLPQPNEIGSSMLLKVCAGQIQGTSFCLYSKNALSSVTATVPNDLSSITGTTLAKSSLDLEVVQVRKQLGPGILEDLNEIQLVPDLLVKDDRIVLTGEAPVVRMTGDPLTDIPADTTKQFWVTLRVPADAKPGTYAGTVLVSGQGVTAFTVPISVQVLPLRLLTASREYGINLRSRLDVPPAALPADGGKELVTDFVTSGELDTQLSDIVQHGIRIVTINEPAALISEELSQFKATGTPGPFVYRGDDDPAAVFPALKSEITDRAYYLPPAGSLAETLALLQAVRKQKLESAAYISDSADYDALQAGLDTPIYYRDEEYALSLVRSGGKRQNDKSDWWFWQVTGEEPAKNRVSSGYLLWRSNLYGAFIPVYQEAFGTDPYDETSAGAVPARAGLRPEMLSYPTSTGVLDSLRWEAVREGINDVRYLTTFYAALRECKDAHIAEPLTEEAEGYVTSFLSKPLANMPESALDAARSRITEYAVQLRSTVDSYNATK